MDCNCNCFGIAASSKRPVKRYNLLVPDVFPKRDPPVDNAVTVQTERHFKRLFEYLEKTPARVPKVSRRLARHVHKDLRRRHYGYVKLAGQAYIYLLKRLPGQDSHLFAKELVCQQVDSAKGQRGRHLHRLPLESVVGALLQHALAEMRALGAQVLQQFASVQTTAAYMEQLEDFVPLVCQSAAQAPHGVRDLQGAAPSPASLRTLNAASLRCLHAYLLLCNRTAVVSPFLQQVEKHVLDHLKPGDVLPVSTAQGGDSLQQQTAAQANQGQAAGAPALASDDPHEAARATWQLLADMSWDAAEGRRVMDLLLAYLDQKRSWTSGDGMVAATLGSLRKAGGDAHQRYQLFCALVRHLGEPSLQPGDRSAVLQQAAEEAASLESIMSFPALICALKELPQHMALPVRTSRTQEPVDTASPASGDGQAPNAAANDGMAAAAVSLVESLATQASEPAHVAEALGGICAVLPEQEALACATLDLCISAACAAAACHKERGRPGVSLPQALLQDVAAQQLQGCCAQTRRLSLQLLCALLPLTLPSGLKEVQSITALSACWHQSQTQQADGEDRGLLCLLTALPGNSSPEALVQAVRLANAYHEQALSPMAATASFGGSALTRPSTDSPKHSESGRSRQGLLGATVHAVGSLLPRRAADAAESTPHPRTLAAGDSTASAAHSNGDLPEAASPLSGGEPDGRAEAAVLANGNGAASVQEPHPCQDVALDNGASMVGTQAFWLHQRMRAVRCHDALLEGVAERTAELAPGHPTSWSFPSKSHSQKMEPGTQQQLSTWLAHPAMRSRQAWLGPVAKALAAAGSSATSTAALQQPFPLLPASTTLPKAKAHVTRGPRQDGCQGTNSSAAATRVRLVGPPSHGPLSAVNQEVMSPHRLPGFQELLQGRDAEPSASTQQHQSNAIDLSALSSALDDLDRGEPTHLREHWKHSVEDGSKAAGIPGTPDSMLGLFQLVRLH